MKRRTNRYTLRYLTLLSLFCFCFLLTSCGKQKITEEIISEPTEKSRRDFAVFGDCFPHYADDGSFCSERDEDLWDTYDTLSSQLGIRFTQVNLGGYTELEAITVSHFSGNVLSDLISCSPSTYVPAARTGSILLPTGERMISAGLDCLQDCWNSSSALSLGFGTTQFGLDIYPKYNSIQTGYFLVFSQPELLSLGYSDIYREVKNGSWTWETFLDISQKAVRDTDGDGITDKFGVSGEINPLEILTSGTDYATYNGSEWIFSFDADDQLDLLENVVSYGTTCVSPNGDPEMNFASGNSLFCFLTAQDLYSNESPLQYSDFAYGIIPLPKSPGAADYTAPSSTIKLYVIPSRISSPEDNAVILNAWATALSDKTACIENTCETICLSDKDSEMLSEIIIPGLKSSVCAVSPQIEKTINEEIYQKLITGSCTPSQAIESVRDLLPRQLNEIFLP